jgi:cytoskeletal protein CcmA (bactofilin family)
MVFGKRDARGDTPQEEMIGSLYSDMTHEPSSSTSTDSRREPSEGILDSHARFNGKFVSDRDLRIDGEAQGEIECQGTLVLSPQARVRASIKAHNVVINGDYEGNVDSGGRFEIGSTGRVKGEIKTQVLVIKEGAFFEGAVVMARKAPEGAPAPAATSGASSGTASTKSGSGGAASSASAAPAAPAASGAPAASSKAATADEEDDALFSKEIVDEPATAMASGIRQPTGPGDATR